MNRILESDFRYMADSDVPWEKIKGKTVLITGGTGFIGSLLIRFFDYLNNSRDMNVKMLVLVRNEEKAQTTLGDYNVILIKGDIRNIPEIASNIDFIFHCAAVTDSRTMVEKPVEVAEGILLGTNSIMKLAYTKNVDSVIFLSSMEVYGSVDTESGWIHENDLGYVDLLCARSCYPMGKRMAENICFDYYHEYGVPVKIARLAQTFGAGVPENDNRIFAQFARSIIKVEDIVLHTDGSSMGNYCYSADAILGLLLILLKGENGEAYNIVNEETCMTIKMMAELVCEKISNGSISVKYDIPPTNKYGYAAASRLRLSADKIRELGWKPVFGIVDMYRRMIGYILESNIEEEGLDE